MADLCGDGVSPLPVSIYPVLFWVIKYPGCPLPVRVFIIQGIKLGIDDTERNVAFRRHGIIVVVYRLKVSKGWPGLRAKRSTALKTALYNFPGNQRTGITQEHIFKTGWVVLVELDLVCFQIYISFSSPSTVVPSLLFQVIFFG